MIYYRFITTTELLRRAKDAANVMHPDYIWSGLCKQIGRQPTQDEWYEICKDSPYRRLNNARS